MTPAELLTYLQRQGVVLWADGDRLRYKAPKEVLTPDLRAGLAECKSEILALLLKSKAFPSVSSLSRQRTSGDKRVPLSYAQHGLWLMAQTTEYPPFNHPLAFRIEGPLKVAVLERSLNEMVSRHEILRTILKVVGEEPVQAVMPKCALALGTLDLRDLDAVERASAVERLATEEAQKPFDHDQGPLLRAKLLKIDDEAYVFILTTHTFAVDGYSHGILLRELGQVYEAFSKGKPSPLPENPIQFADYVLWQHKMLHEGHLESQITYWRQQLKDTPSMLRWPVDNLGLTVAGYRGETKDFSLPMDLSESIRRLGRHEGVTVFAVLLAALKTFLYRLTRQADLVVGTMVSSRSRSELENSIGYFANNLLLCTQVSDQMAFRELLLRCHEVTADALANQDFPFEKLLEELSSDPDISTIPMLQVMFVLHDHVAEEDLQLPGLSLKRFPVERGAASFDLYLRMANANGPLCGSMEYRTGIFDSDTIERIYSHFQTLLKCVVTDPQQRLAALPVLRKAERDELIQAWNKALSNREVNKHLPSSNGLKQGKRASEMEPQTKLERIVASIWQEILKLEDVSIYDNFFDVGGRSLHIIQVHSRLKRFLKRDIPIVDLFRYPTIRSLSQFLGREGVEQPSLRRSHNRADLLRMSRERRMRARARR